MSNTQVVEVQEIGSNELATIQDTSQIMLDEKAMDRIISFGKLMAKGKCSVPTHLAGNEADCTAVAMQAVQWRMNPYAVASKTFLAPNGTLSYEAQLINAVITTLAPIKNRPSYEFFGDWTKIQGKLKKMQSEGKKPYFVSDWKDSDEQGLGVIIRCTLKGEDEPRELELLLVQCQPRFSTQWATDPQQQITYAAIRKWSRRYTPDVILGVYTPDELADVPVSKELNQKPRSGSAIAEAAKHADVSEDTANERMALLKQLTPIAEKKGLVAYAEAWGVLSAHQRKVVGTVEHESLKVVANAFDESRTYENQPSTTSAVVDADFVGEMNEAEANK